MVCCRVFGNDTTIAVAASQGQFELNVFKPVIIDAMLQSIRLLADAANSFTDHCVVGIRANEPRIRELLQNSLMLVTALAPHIGYDKAAQIAKTAHANGTTLREEAVRLGYVSAKDFDRLVQPARMTHPDPEAVTAATPGFSAITAKMLFISGRFYYVVSRSADCIAGHATCTRDSRALEQNPVNRRPQGCARHGRNHQSS